MSFAHSATVPVPLPRYARLSATAGRQSKIQNPKSKIAPCRTPPWAVLAVLLAHAAVVCAQTTTAPSVTEIDACGVLISGGNCVMFSGGGGNYVLSDYGNYRVGDAVRVVGTLDPQCATICGSADGCIRGAVVYDPSVLPCGTPLPSFPGDLLSGLCSAVSAGIAASTAGGLLLLRRGRKRR